MCVCVSEFFTGWMDLQGLIFVTNAILEDRYVIYIILIYLLPVSVNTCSQVTCF